jgi:hypothetical protein
VAADATGCEVKFLASRRRLAAAVFLILLVLFLARPGASRLKVRITNSVSRALDRHVEIGAVHLRFLPRPGFDLENVVIDDDPAFGAEPMLRAAEVTAVVRITSLLRGRFDIARLELTEPSLNLVHRKEDGRWNLEALLERSARTPLAPTTKPKSEARLGFPYIEASDGRINFKSGAEKKPYALLNADFALWQESENGWGVRLQAEPTRTDMNLSDSGLIRMSGRWLRAGSLRETPLQFSVEWDRAQLGQVTKLVSGIDKGWRGDVRLEAKLSGTPGGLQVGADASVQNFHRYDIAASEGLGAAAHCDGKYSSAEGVMHEIFCSVPVGNGLITLHGDAGRPGVSTLNLVMNVENVSANSVAQLARRAKRDLPSDLVASGNLRGNFTVKREGDAPADFQGKGEIADLHLESASANAAVAVESLPFVLTSDESADVSGGKKKRREFPADTSAPANPLRIECGPFAVGLGRASTAQVRGWIGWAGYGIAVRGDAEVSHALQMAGLIGLPTTRADVQGDAQMDLEIAGSWRGNENGTTASFSMPRVTGTAQLHNVHAVVHGVNRPVEISSAELRLTAGEARLDKLSARAAGARWTGSVTVPRGCGTPGACLIHFNLNADQIGMSGLYAWLGAHPDARRWYQVLTPEQSGTPMLVDNLRAAWKVSVAQMLIRNLTMNHVAAEVELAGGKLKVSNLSFDVLDGKHRGDWQVDFTGATPVYSGSGMLANLSLERLADAMHESWISGTATGSYRVTASGRNLAAFWQSADAGITFDVRDGRLPRISLDSGDDPLQIGRWQGTARVRKGNVEIEKSEIVSGTATYGISGTVSAGQVLDLKLTGAAIYNITGTLAEPHVQASSAPETQARLKP